MWRFFQNSLVFALLFSCGCNTPVLASQTYGIGVDPSWYPLQLAGQEPNVLAFSIELLTMIAKEENLQLTVQTMSWDNLMWGLQGKKYNAVLSPLRPYTFYEKKFSFSNPYLNSGPVLVVPKDSHIKKLHDLKGKEIGVVRGSSAALLLQTVPGILLQGYDSIALALEALEKEDVDAAVLEVLIVQNYVRNLYKDVLKIAGQPLNNEGLRLISLFQQSPKLLKSFDRGLAALKKKGEYAKLLKKWGLSPDGEPIADLVHRFKSSS